MLIVGRSGRELMELPKPPQAIVALAALLRDRLAELPGAGAPLLARRADAVGAAGDRALRSAARQAATTIVAAAAPFAPTSYARMRLIRQMHASGLLSSDEARRGEAVLSLVPDRSPRPSEATVIDVKPGVEPRDAPKRR